MARHFSFERFLNVQSAYAPSFSSGGDQLRFISDITGLPQVFQIDKPGTWPEQLTFGQERVGTVKSSPVRPELVFGMDTGGNERQQLFYLGEGGADIRPLTDQPEAIHTFGAFSPDGSQIAYTANRRHSAHFDVFVQAIPDGEPTSVWEAEGMRSVADWSPDGRTLLIGKAHSLLHHELFCLDLDAGTLARLTPESAGARFTGAHWLPAGDTVVCLTDYEHEFLAPATIDVTTGQIQRLAVTEWDAEHLAVSPDGARLAYALNADGYSELHVQELDTDQRSTIESLPSGIIGARPDVAPLTFAPDGRRLAFTFTGAKHNPDVWMVEIDGSTPERATRSARAGIPQSEFVEPELIRYPTFDDRAIPAFYYPPREQAGNWPVVVYVHGGPESQFRPDFNPVIQYFCHRGYGVLATNVRGSTGYGRSFSHLDDVEARMDAVADLRYAVEWLKTVGNADPNRIAVMGGSYGGFMVLAAVTSYPDIWAAAVDIVGIANFVTFLENTGPWRRHLREAEYGSLEHDRELLEAISPIHQVERITAPLMVIHGANDPRVPVGEAEQIVDQLQSRRHPVEYLRYEDEGHGLVKLANKLDAYPRVADFLTRHLQGNPTTAS
ncbi:MAG: alpha/beta fold hydrolase [Candidatus Bipolaricaulia bacterium]